MWKTQCRHRQAGVGVHAVVPPFSPAGTPPWALARLPERRKEAGHGGSQGGTQPGGGPGRGGAGGPRSRTGSVGSPRAPPRGRQGSGRRIQTPPVLPGFEEKRALWFSREMAGAGR